MTTRVTGVRGRIHGFGPRLEHAPADVVREADRDGGTGRGEEPAEAEEPGEAEGRRPWGRAAGGGVFGAAAGVTGVS
ncbi:hypothetical protein JK361_31840 [Streptomyces sp. 5-8]|uniref:Uncharacterized protein n=1 Tax=Streptomyces musisoli TaxID=2802280 RepID=A0ABS1P9S6_9ACTN|nr:MULTISPECIES: hypothetical protein [Streptomyces]MBL1109127.1 hypothetical protein [Streptomyces musisoli]MBY8842586.1 hypothetical protein [Streptomyces sp. SP2-10]